MDPVEMFERAGIAAARLARTVQPTQMDMPTPCAEWDVAALLDHMAGGPTYLLEAMGIGGDGPVWPDAGLVEQCLEALRAEGVAELRCQSPAGFEWSILEAAAGTAMDQLIHTWDLAVALGVDPSLDHDVVEAVVSMFLPAMPEMGRQVGFVGPAVEVGPDASPQDVLLGAMGRDPRR